MFVVEAAGLKAITPGNLLCKYADDTYIIIPVSSSHTRTIELEHIDSWAKLNNLTLNRAKTVEVIFADKKSKRTATPPLPLPDITQCTTLKILGVTITNGLSMAEHIHGIMSSCSQTLHALRVLRAQCMPASALHEVFRAVVIAKLCYASSAWRGFSTAGDNQRVTSFIRRSIPQGCCTTDLTDITSFIDTADDTLFRQILTNPNHVLAHLLPEKVKTHYQLRPRQHDRQLIPKTTKLYSCNFVIRMLYKHSY